MSAVNPLEMARAEAVEAEQTFGAIRHMHLTAVQAYATLAVAEALGALVATPPHVLVGARDDITRGYL